MKQSFFKSFISESWLVFVFLIGSVLTFIPCHSSGASLSGPSFTDPVQIMEMPTKWITRPINYEKSSTNADLVVTLDQHLYPAILPIINRFAKEYRKLIIVNEGTCGISAGMLSRKTADIGGFCCPPGLTDRLPGLKFHTIGISSLALLVHPDNPVDNVTFEQAQQMFGGAILRWSELTTSKGDKGPNLPIQPIGRLHCKLRPGHWRILLDNQDMFSTGLQEVGAIADMISSVSLRENAVGYEILWNIIRHRKRGETVALSINGYSPYNQDALKSNKYPLYRVFNLTTWVGESVSNPLADQLVEFIIKNMSRVGPEYHFVPVKDLHQAGWKFTVNELTGEPDTK